MASARNIRPLMNMVQLSSFDRYTLNKRRARLPVCLLRMNTGSRSSGLPDTYFFYTLVSRLSLAEITSRRSRRRSWLPVSRVTAQYLCMYNIHCI